MARPEANYSKLAAVIIIRTMEDTTKMVNSRYPKTFHLREASGNEIPLEMKGISESSAGKI